MLSKTNQLEIRHIRYFLILADTLHFRKAAEKIFISQSALSQQINLLETILNVKLFERTNRRVSLSVAGVLFLEEAKGIMNYFDTSLKRWQQSLDGNNGQLKISFVGSAMKNYLPPIIKQFTNDFSNVRLSLEELTNSDQLRGLEQDNIDIGFMRSNKVLPHMNIKPVYIENFSLVLPQDHPINGKNFNNIGQCANESFILYPNESSPMYFQQILNLCSKHNFSPKISHRAIHGGTIFKLVENGMGLSIIPNSLKDENNYKIRFIELNNSELKTELFAVWKKDYKNPVLKSFLKRI
ncbi:LysR family transcriptional regulator [Sabulilitoribacter arenilitoris]|uniref:LysR family transcriptional regulator n=1 Tax=Wocania arenilitoris TaxID=2044858 RepID=A0AAE3EN15_9FLAO|nr:LysR family transcriptional regulator [Wocania arenilitoris]MCF7567079.1 LysR family transcriptional regulator [Wocania arenilitoris]